MSEWSIFSKFCSVFFAFSIPFVAYYAWSEKKEDRRRQNKKFIKKRRKIKALKYNHNRKR